MATEGDGGMMIYTAIEKEIIEQLREKRIEYPLDREELAGRLRWRGLLKSRDDRLMRKAIEDLRKRGFLICHRKGSDGGYYMAANKAEYEDFRSREYKSRIVSLADTLRMMDKSAELQFGEEIQLELFQI